MLTDYFKSPITLERYRSRLIGPHLDAFTAWLDEHGYRRVSIRRHVREVTHFSAWAETAGIRVEGLNQDALDRLHWYLASGNNCAIATVAFSISTKVLAYS